MSRIVSLKLNPRPLRLAYLVRDRGDLLDGVRLLTHIWGGKTDVLLPQPRNDEDRNRLLDVLGEFDPDFMLLGAGEVSADLSECLAPLPCSKRQLRAGEASEFIDGLNPLHLGPGPVTDPYSVLKHQYPGGLQESRIRVLDHGSPFDFVTRVAWGDPSASAIAWLHNNFAAKLLRAPHDAQALVRTSLVANSRATPIDISSTAVLPRLSYRGFVGIDNPLRGPLIQNDHTVFFFLDDGESISIPCAYWNARTGAGANKLLLPFNLFRDNLSQILRDTSTTRRVDEWIFVAELNDHDAGQLLNGINAALEEERLSGTVAVISGGFRYSVPPFRAISGGSTSMSLSLGVEDDVRFVAPRPKYFPGTGAFGFDAEVERPDGEKLSLPVSTDSALLLSNSPDRLKRFETNEAGLGILWLQRGLPIRARLDGIAGVTTSEEECTWYLPTPSRLIQQALNSRGISLSANRHTRYATGVANRLGGLENALAFARAGGFALLRPLLGDRAAQAGLRSQQFQQLLESEAGLSRDAAQKAMVLHLPKLLETGLIRRGFALRCTHCDLTDWYGVANLSEFVECLGCSELFQLSGPRLPFSYRINELAKRMSSEGGLAVFSTASALDSLGGGQNIQLGGNLTRKSESEPFAEVDILSVNRDAFAIVECKDRRDLTSLPALQEVVGSLERAIAVAPSLGAEIVLLGIQSERWNADLFEMVSGLARRAAEAGLAVHLVLNGQFHLAGSEDASDLRRMGLAELLLDIGDEGQLRVTGKLPTTFGAGSLLPVVADSVIGAWEFSALDRPEFP